MSEAQNQSTASQPSPSANQHVQKADTNRGQHHLAPQRRQPLSTLWAASPFALMRQFSMDLDRLFGNALTYDSATPQIEVFERGNQFVVRADLPGLSKNDVTVELADDMLVISGERREKHEGTRQGLRVSERQYGRFVRRVPLPDGVSGENAQATFQNGVLEVAIPTPAGHRQGRRIEIQDGPGASASTSDDRSQASA